MLNIKKTANTAILKAGDKALKEFYNFNRTTIRKKSQHEIVTPVDISSEKIIIAEIKKNFPKHRIFSEEKGAIKGTEDYLWLIDPIDGTTNFSMHNPLWSISIGVFLKKKVVYGLIYAPALGEIYEAEISKGAYMREIRRGTKESKKRMKVSNVKKGKVLNTFCHGSKNKDIARAIKYHKYQKLNGFDCRQIGSAAIEAAFVAAGRIESIMIPGVNSYDIAAGVLLVREAGGRATNFQGKNWNLNSHDILVSNGKVHENILRIIKKI